MSSICSRHSYFFFVIRLVCCCHSCHAWGPHHQVQVLTCSRHNTSRFCHHLSVDKNPQVSLQGASSAHGKILPFSVVHPHADLCVASLYPGTSLSTVMFRVRRSACDCFLPLSGLLCSHMLAPEFAPTFAALSTLAMMHHTKSWLISAVYRETCKLFLVLALASGFCGLCAAFSALSTVCQGARRFLGAPPHTALKGCSH
jgi:hypothetical protein